MKQINIFGRKVSVVAVLIVALLVGTASAAVFMNYATLSGDVTVTSPIVVSDSGGPMNIGDIDGVLNFDSPPATFTIQNTGTEGVIVYLVSTIIEGDETVPTGDAVSVIYTASGSNQVDTDGSLLINGEEIITVDVDLSSEANVVGTYTVTVAVNPAT